MSCPASVSSAPARFPFQASVTCKAASDENSHMPCRASLRRTTSVVPCAVEMVKGASLPVSILQKARHAGLAKTHEYQFVSVIGIAYAWRIREITHGWAFDRVRDSAVATGTNQSLMARV